MSKVTMSAKVKLPNQWLFMCTQSPHQAIMDVFLDKVEVTDAVTGRAFAGAALLVLSVRDNYLTAEQLDLTIRDYILKLVFRQSAAYFKEMDQTVYPVWDTEFGKLDTIKTITEGVRLPKTCAQLKDDMWENFAYLREIDSPATRAGFEIYNAILAASQTNLDLVSHWIALMRRIAVGLESPMLVNTCLSALHQCDMMIGESRAAPFFGQGLMAWYMNRSRFDSDADREALEAIARLPGKARSPAKITDMLSSWEFSRVGCNTLLRKEVVPIDDYATAAILYIRRLSGYGTVFLELIKLPKPNTSVPKRWPIDGIKYEPLGFMRDALRSSAYLLHCLGRCEREGDKVAIAKLIRSVSASIEKHIPRVGM